MLSLSRCKDCGATGVAGSVIVCGCIKPAEDTLPEGMVDRSGQPLFVQPFDWQVANDPPVGCLHRGDHIGTVNCGCAGEYTAYWCNKLAGHCTLTSPGKWWDKITTGHGQETIKRVGKLTPCLHCTERDNSP